MNAHPIVVSGTITDDIIDIISHQIGGNILRRNDNLLIISASHYLPKARLAALRQKLNVDINQLPESFQAGNVGLLISDMDSTFITIECVDEIADFADIRPQVAAITESTMRGEIDFETSLEQRVSLLADLDTSALEHVYNERLQLNPGAEDLVKGLHEKAIPFALVSGGFTFFTEKLKARYALDFAKANILEIIDNKLTGKILGEIVGAQTKADYLDELCQTLSIEPNQIIAMGDGANDLLMMEKASLSVGYCAKPIVQERADIVINHSPLSVVIDLISND